MADVIAQPAADLSFADLRSMVAGETPKEVKPEPKVEVKEPESAEVVEETPETAEVVETKQEAEPEEELPKGVQRRIAKEVARQAEIDRKIHEAVAATKAKEAELAKVSSATGSEPVKTEPVTKGKPVRPEFGEGEHAGEDWKGYQKRLSEYEDARDAWVLEEGRKQGKAEREADEFKKQARKAWDEQVKKHGTEFPDRVKSLQAKVPEDVQIAIGNLEHWGDVAMHLEGNADALAVVMREFQVSPTRGIAALGKLEDKVTAPKQDSAKQEELPDPPKKVGGRTSVSAGTVDLEKIPFSSFKAEVGRRLGKTG